MLPKNYKPSKPILVLSIALLIALGGYGLKSILDRRAAFSSGIRYTIGYTTEIYFTTSGRNIRYKYQVNNLEYIRNHPYAYNSTVPGGRYWVKFSIHKPDISTIYQNKPVTSEIEYIIPEGLPAIPK